jgi:hypothetical protein
MKRYFQILKAGLLAAVLLVMALSFYSGEAGAASTYFCKNEGDSCQACTDTGTCYDLERAV